MGGLPAREARWAFGQHAQARHPAGLHDDDGCGDAPARVQEPSLLYKDTHFRRTDTLPVPGIPEP